MGRVRAMPGFVGLECRSKWPDRAFGRAGIHPAPSRIFPWTEVGFSGLTIVIVAFLASISPRSEDSRETAHDEVRIHDSRIESVAFSPDGGTAASASRDGTLKLLEVRTQSLVAVARSGCGYSSVAFSPDGRKILAGGLDGRVSLRDATTGVETEAHLASSLSIRAVAFSPGGDSISAAGDDGIIRTWDVRSGREEPPMRGHAGAVLGLSYAPDEKTLASAGNDGIVVLWDSASRKMLSCFDSSCGRAGAVEFAPDGQTIAVGGSEGLAVLDVPHGLPKFRRGTSSPVTSVRFCRGGSAVLTSTLDGVIDLVGISHERFFPVRRLGLTPSRVKALAVSPDGMTFVTGADDALLRFYRLSQAR